MERRLHWMEAVWWEVSCRSVVLDREDCWVCIYDVLMIIEMQDVIAKFPTQ